MSAPGTVTIVWANGEDQFCLSKLGLLLELEEKCGASVGVIWKRLATGDFGIRDIREPIRIGLMGGGMPPKDALETVRRHVDENPLGLAPSALVAFSVVDAVLSGVPNDPVGKKDNDEGKAPPAEAGTSSSTMTGGSDAQN